MERRKNEDEALNVEIGDIKKVSQVDKKLPVVSYADPLKKNLEKRVDYMKSPAEYGAEMKVEPALFEMREREPC